MTNVKPATVLSEISFYSRFVEDILSGKKTITIRNSDECHFALGKTIPATHFNSSEVFAHLSINDVTAIQFSELNEHHAQQENMSLNELKNVIQEIYPNEHQLYVIHFTLRTELAAYNGARTG